MRRTEQAFESKLCIKDIRDEIKHNFLLDKECCTVYDNMVWITNTLSFWCKDISKKLSHLISKNDNQNKYGQEAIL